MALASTAKVVLGSIAFAIFWILAVFLSVPLLPVGRTADPRPPLRMSHFLSQESNRRLSSSPTGIQSSPKANGSPVNPETIRNRLVSSENEIRMASLNNGLNEDNIFTTSKGVVSVEMRSNDGKETPSAKWKRLVWKSCVYLVTVGMLVSLLMGLNMSWTAITAALALVVLDF
ncbi:hypothetical protein CRG98_001353 [Punica granatum]|uniref:Uncharacterized protein n=1 Tax=Punica granatum TaxID=22663 RepID=A0A2I0LC89_PUNGR|nr:hypothetical protein CRG98_001353 [Punica granatum]